MEKRQPRTLDAIAAHRDRPDAIVEAGEVLDLRFPSGSGGTLSLRAGKLLHLLIHEAGVRVADAVTHKVPLAALDEVFHIGAEEVEGLLDELHTTVLKLRLTDAQGRRFVKSGPFLADAERETEPDSQAEIRYELSPTLRKAIANSTHWGILSRQAVMAFESRYSLRLYTALSLRAGLRKAAEDFPMDDLRELLGVPAGKLARWQDFKRFVLMRAVDEVNHLSGLRVRYEPIQRGRKIVGVRLGWDMKRGAEAMEALQELARPRIGRKARREGAVEEVVAPETRERELLAEALFEAPCPSHTLTAPLPG